MSQAAPITKEFIMSKRIDLKNTIYGDLLVLEFHATENTHAVWKCLCMLCNNLVYVTASNLRSGNTKSCGRKTTTYIQEYEVIEMLNNGMRVCNISRNTGLSRGTIYRIKKEWSKEEI